MTRRFFFSKSLASASGSNAGATMTSVNTSASASASASGTGRLSATIPPKAEIGIAGVGLHVRRGDVGRALPHRRGWRA